MTETRAAYAGQQEAQLDPKTLERLRAAYQEICDRTGYGTIKIRIEAAGSSKESQFVSVENEEKTV